ncbi:MAG: MATE family efflux transporter [Acidobacteria bacterium]|nr:MATE family efflux transporter [Acidobacteriota bacterium]
MIRSHLPYYRGLLKLGVPLVLTQAGQMSVQLIDNAMIGHYGTAELAAASFANNIYIVVMLLGMGMFMGITPLIGHARGAKDDRLAAVILKSGWVLSAFLIPLLALVSWSVVWIMPAMGQTGEVVRLAVPYYKTLVVALIPLLLFSFLKQAGEGLGNTFAAMAATLASNLINVFLNYTLIFGKFGFPELGLLGAGYATILSRTAMPLMLYAVFMTLKPIRYYFSLMRTVPPALHEIARIAGIGLPIAVQLVLEVSAFAASAVMMGWMGHAPLAAHEVAIGLASFTFMAANGVAMATTIRVSFQLGTRDFQSMRRVSYSALHLVLFYMGLCGLCFFLFRDRLPRIFTGDPGVIAQAASLLAVAALFQLFDGLQVVCLGILRGFADVKIPMFIAGFSYIIVGLPVSYICAFPLGLGPEGIWVGFVFGLLTAGSLLSLRIGNRIRQTEARS